MALNLADTFLGVAAKNLTAVDAEPDRSNQHEIGGLIQAGFDKFMGRPAKGDKVYLNCDMAYITDDEDQSVFDTCQVSWYDSRHKDPSRGPEYRLYYRANSVTERLAEGDFLVIAYKSDSNLQMIFAEADSISAQELANVFSVQSVSTSFKKVEVEASEISLPLRLVLEDCGIELPVSHEREALSYLDEMVGRFGGIFPDTKTFSRYARTSAGETDGMSADDKLVHWMEFEESLFRVLERHIVSEVIDAGFGDDDSRVDDFINFSLSVQNRRKSRAGYAFENHLGEIFKLAGLRFEKGSAKRTTENKSKPDFLFPGFSEYHDSTFPVEKLTLLGAKTSCKDRWRQVLAEGERIGKKHLATLQPGITLNQLHEMQAQDLNLVVPQSVREIYPTKDQVLLTSMEEFVAEVLERAKE